MNEHLHPAPAAADFPPVLAVRDLTVSFSLPGGTAHAVEDVSFDIQPGKVVGMVGESGSGKSMTALAITRMLPPAARISGGSVLFGGRDLVTVTDKDMQRIRGGGIGMVFQDPLASLNPLMTVGSQIEEVLRLHGASREDAARRTVELLEQVGIRNPDKAARARPHEFSGGMRQRVMIAIAIANNPKLLIADEPTTALDVTIQAEVLRLLTRLRDELGMAVLLITHDITVVEEVCDQVVVLYGGRVAETGGRDDVLADPRHPYAYQLMRAVPRLGTRRQDLLPAIPGHPPDIAERGAGCPFMPRCEFAEDRCEAQPALRPAPRGSEGHLAACWVINDAGQRLEPAGAEPQAAQVRDLPAAAPVLAIDGMVVDYARGRARRRPHVPAVDGVSLTASPGRTLGLVGESGSGKTTVARAAVGLVPAAAGTVTVSGYDWRTAGHAEKARMRADIQLVFQDPYASLNPRWRVSQILDEPLRRQPPERRADPGELLLRVGLPARFLDRYPDELSGGQRQRVGIARALAVNPKVIVADEPVSALDVSVQAQVINLLTELRAELGLGLVFVAHDLAVVRHVSDDLAVMYLGRIVESGPAADVFAKPRHPYTALLMSSAPGQEGAGNPGGQTATAPAIDLTWGCRFRNRCPIGPLVHPERTICEQDDPALKSGGDPHRSACHFSEETSPVLT